MHRFNTRVVQVSAVKCFLMDPILMKFATAFSVLYVFLETEGLVQLAS